MIIFSIAVAEIGFEFPSYTFNETDGSGEICVVLSSPNVDESLVFDVVTAYETRSGTAGKNRLL